MGIEFLLTSGAAAASLALSIMLPQAVAALYGWDWSTREGAIAGSAVGLVVALLFLAVPTITGPGGIWEGMWGTVANIAVFVGVSLVTDSTPQRAKSAEWQETLGMSYGELEGEFRDMRERERAVFSASDD